MQVIEIKTLENGSHRNQTGNFKKIPDGFAVIPDDMVLENFPFGKLHYRTINGIKTVTAWEALPLPEVENYEEIPSPTLEERVTALESIVEKLKKGTTYENKN